MFSFDAIGATANILARAGKAPHSYTVMRLSSIRGLSRAPIAACAAVALLAGCGRRDARPTRDTLVARPAPAGSAGRSTDAWAADLGTALLVPSDSDGIGVLLHPDDLDGLHTDSVTLVGTSGSVGHARLDTAASEYVCGDAPLVRVQSPAPGWSAALAGLSAEPIAMDSIEAMPSRDSAMLAANIARLASAAATHSDTSFRGLPFVVVAAHRLRWAERELVIAHLVRRLNQEAAPREEHTLLIAERPRDAVPSDLTVVMRERSEGSEETAEHYDVLAALRDGGVLRVLIARDQNARTRYDLLERAPSGAWRTRWTRVVAC